MKFRGRHHQEKIEAQMAPMIDVVFQLLIFFMLTLKIVEPEGDFSVNMPIGQAPSDSDSIPPQVIKIRMQADPVTGELTSIQMGRTELYQTVRAATPEQRAELAFKNLNNEILKVIGVPGSPVAEEQEVELDPDYELHSKYLINAIGACRGRVERTDDGKTRMVDYIKNIKFAPPREERI